MASQRDVPEIVLQMTRIWETADLACAGIVKAIAEAAGKEPKIVLYDPAAVDIEKGKGFHFRRAVVALRALCWLLVRLLA